MATTPQLTSILRDAGKVSQQISGYSEYFKNNEKEDVEARKNNAKEITSTFYRLVTDFYEYGFGDAFHFCPLEKGKSFDDCIYQQDVRQGDRLEVGPGKKVVVRGKSSNRTQ